MKKIISVFLVLIIILSCVPVYAADIKGTFTIPAADKKIMNSREQEFYIDSVNTAMANVHPGMSDLQIVHAIHDWITSNVGYDYYSQEMYYQGQSAGSRTHSAVAAFVDRECVCDGFSKAFKTLMDYCGIPCEIVTSSEMYHSWNLVQLNGNWYHVDNTWDSSGMGFSGHSYLLLSDDSISADHYGWTSNHKCTDKRYESASWKNDGAWTHIFTGKDTVYAVYEDGNLYCCSESTGSKKIAVDNGKMKLACNPVYDGSNIYFVANDGIHIMDPASQRQMLIMSEKDLLLSNLAFASGIDVDAFIRSMGIDEYRWMTIEGKMIHLSVEGNDFLRHDWIDLLYPILSGFEFPGVPTSSAGDRNNPFKDVAESDKFFNPVMWALENNVTKGTSSTTFSPYDTCTRGETVTFLWRAAGCPEPATKKNPFADIKESDYYYKPILWAVEKGITNGTSKTTFSPEEICSTAHIVTFIWRALNQNWVNTGANWWDSAFAWANGKKMLELNITVTPSDPSPRCDVVSMLWLYAQDNN